MKKTVRFGIGSFALLYGLTLFFGAFRSIWSFIFFILGTIICVSGFYFSIGRRWAKWLLSSLLIISLFIVFPLYFLRDKGEISIVNKDREEIHSAETNLPYLIKFAAVIERQHYYKTWVNQIIDPEYTNDEDRINKIFEWVNSIKTQPVVELGNVDQHRYYTLIKQYGELSEKLEVFCNLMASVGYQASKIYESNQGEVIVRIPEEEKFLYFDIKYKREDPEISDADKKICEEKLKNLSTILGKTQKICYSVTE